MRKTFGKDLTVWDATNSPGSPLCVGSSLKNSLSVNVYEGESGIIGVTVTDGRDVVGMFGTIPGAAAADIVSDFDSVSSGALGSFLKHVGFVSTKRRSHLPEVDLIGDDCFGL